MTTYDENGRKPYMFDGWERMPAWNADAEVFNETELEEAAAENDGSHLLAPEFEHLEEFINRHFPAMDETVSRAVAEHLHDNWFEYNDADQHTVTARSFVSGYITGMVRLYDPRFDKQEK